VKLKKRILLVEDEPSVALVTRLRLEHQGYEVEVATDGEEALHKATSREEIDLVLLDLKLPKLDGFEVCRRLKKDPSTAQIPVIIYTASEARWETLMDRCVDLGVNDLLRKPFNTQELITKVHQVLQGKSPLK